MTSKMKGIFYFDTPSRKSRLTEVVVDELHLPDGEVVASVECLPVGGEPGIQLVAAANPGGETAHGTLGVGAGEIL